MNIEKLLTKQGPSEGSILIRPADLSEVFTLRVLKFATRDGEIRPTSSKIFPDKWGSGRKSFTV